MFCGTSQAKCFGTVFSKICECFLMFEFCMLEFDSVVSVQLPKLLFAISMCLQKNPTHPSPAYLQWVGENSCLPFQAEELEITENSNSLRDHYWFLYKQFRKLDTHESKLPAFQKEINLGLPCIERQYQGAFYFVLKFLLLK